MIRAKVIGEFLPYRTSNKTKKCITSTNDSLKKYEVQYTKSQPNNLSQYIILLKNANF